jgi:hypothetical protein
MFFAERHQDLTTPIVKRDNLRAPSLTFGLCVPKIRFCNIDGEGHQGQVVR